MGNGHISWSFSSGPALVFDLGWVLVPALIKDLRHGSRLVQETCLEILVGVSLVQPLKAEHELGPELEVDVLDVADGQDLHPDDDLQFFTNGRHRRVVDAVLENFFFIIFAA